MEVENSAVDGDSNQSNRAKEHNGEDFNKYMNGINGYSDKSKSHKSDHKDKHRDKDRDKDKHRSKEHKSSSRDKDKEKHSSSKEKDKDRHSSSHKSSSKDKDREKSKDKHRDKEREKNKDKERDQDRHRDDKKSSSSSSSKDKDRDQKSSKEKEHKSSSRDKDRDKEKRDKDKEREREKERSKESSSKDKDKLKHSGSKDKHRDKDKHSSSKDKDRKDRDKDKKHKKDKERDVTETSQIAEIEEYNLGMEIKQDYSSQQINYKQEDASTDDDDDKLIIKDEPSSQDEAEAPNNFSQASSCDYNMSQFDRNESAFEYSDEERNGNLENSQDEDFKVKQEKQEEDSEEDIPLASRMSNSKRKLESEEEEDDEDDVPLMARKKIKKEKSVKKEKSKKKRDLSEDEDVYCKPEKKKKIKKEKGKVKQEIKTENESPKKKKKKEEDEQEVWKWWEEEKKDDGVKWNFLEHKGPVFAPPYEPLPDNVKFFYDGKEMKLSQDAEEIAGFYAKMLDHDYTTKDAFNKNFFSDWRKAMTSKEQEVIRDLRKCNFKQMHAYFMDLAEKNRNRTKEEKKALKEKNEEMAKEYGFCVIDGHKEKIGNFKIEPPGLFRGRGEHPKMGKLKRRVEAEDIIINCSQDSKIPEPPKGHRWREVRHDNKVTWLASWTENVQNQVKYIMLNPSSKLKGEKDWQKYETARRLHKCVDKIRENYQADWKSKEMKVRQRAVALYFIDKLALRAGNEKDEDQADTVGCCSLRVEHIELHEEKDGKEYVVVFDFLGKDSIRYYNEVPVEKRVFKNLTLFMEGKKNGDDLFDRLNTSIMNKHLNDLMEGLTAKVFRTYNASWTLQQQLDLLTNEDDTVAEKILSYNRANRAVAILCNHQRAVPKGHQKSMEKLKEKIQDKRTQIKEAERQVKDAQRDAKHGSVKEKVVYDKKKKMLERLKEQLTKLEIQETDRDENKTIALGTSKLNYLDPRISVAWCKKYGVPIEKIYNKTQRDKFRWAIDMAGPDYRF
ncbi:DNA topoisomerase I, mitochondrial isoform X1 [Cylas formicarius]|uniref:DNA topoisomerase I, mitochondrial isoform X1 n=1 Tax=Cylas formicarius TaxID=197179 RepID=UPI002958CEA8|nr:DNA topoisomerase I, mitochondrial isoform X1 [Cylas formicarius]